MQSSDENDGVRAGKEATPYSAGEPMPVPLNSGGIISIGAVIVATIGSIVPFVSVPPRDGSPSGLTSSVIQFLEHALYGSFLNALPTVWFFSMVLIALLTIAGFVGFHTRSFYVWQVILSAFAIFWGFLSILTFSKPGRFHVDTHLMLDWGFYLYLVAFILSIIAGLRSVRWAEREQKRKLVQSLQIAEH